MIETTAKLLPYKVLFSHILLIILFLALLFRNSWGAVLSRLIGKYALFLALFVSTAAVLGSLFYSNVMGFEPCLLCWWQRIFLYPLAIILSCTAIEGACSKIYVMAFGYITIPVMSLTVSLYILLLIWADRIYKNEDRNS